MVQDVRIGGIQFLANWWTDASVLPGLLAGGLPRRLPTWTSVLSVSHVSWLPQSKQVGGQQRGPARWKTQSLISWAWKWHPITFALFSLMEASHYDQLTLKGRELHPWEPCQKLPTYPWWLLGVYFPGILGPTLYSRTVILTVWFPNQQHHLGTCYNCTFSGPIQTYWIRNFGNGT